MTQRIILRDNQSYDIPVGEFVKVRGWLTRKREVDLVVELNDVSDIQRAGDTEIQLTRLPNKSRITVRAKGNVDFPPEHSATVAVEQLGAQAVTVELPETRLDGSPESAVGVLIPSADGKSITVQALSSVLESSLSRSATTIGSALRMTGKDKAKTEKIHVYIDKTASTARAVDEDVLDSLAEMVKGIGKYYQCELVGDDISDICTLLSENLSSVGSTRANVEERSALVIITDSLRPSMASYKRPTVVMVIGPNAADEVRLFQEAYPWQEHLHAIAITAETIQALQGGNHKALVEEAQIISDGLT